MTHNLERFQHGMAVLLEKLGPTHPRYQEVLDYQRRLERVVAKVERYGESVDTQAERGEILTDCDQLSRMTTGQSFFSYCPELPSIEPVIAAENIGVVGDHAHIEGGIHHHVPGETVTVAMPPSVWARWREKYPWRFYPALTFGILLFLISGAALAGTLFPDVRQALFVHGLWPGVFPKARPGETLIIVADFEQRGGSLATDPAQYIYEQLQAQVEADNLDMRVERLRQVVDDTTARPTGKAYRATLLLWGWYTSEAISPRLERLQLETLPDHSVVEGTVLLLAEPETLAFKTLIVEDLPDLTAYLVFFTMGLAEYSQDYYSETAQRYFESALAAAGPGASYVAETYFYQGNLCYFREDPVNAIAAYTRALELYPEAIEAYNNRGVNYNDMGEYQKAAEDLSRALELDPEDVEAYYNRGVNYHAMGEYEKAAEDFSHVLELNSEDATAYNNRGATYHNMGEYEKAEADYTRALELDPDTAKAYHNRGVNYHAMGEYEKAMEDFNYVLELDPDLAEAYHNRGVTYNAMGKYALALADFERAVVLMSHPSSYYHGAVAHAHLEHITEACTWLENALTLVPQGIAQARTDPAFDSIRDEPCFQALMEDQQ